ncbi:MAG: cytidylate kinase-like family protein [Clostridiaceae bacterium]|nr:cytidylate kinase-like family protein [Clostridiaceae bacterium]
MAIITISRQLGSLGSETAEMLGKRLGMRLILKDTVLNEWMADVVNDHQLRMLTESPKFYLNIMDDGISYKEYIESKLRDEASRQPLIIVGMGSQLIFADHPGVVRVRMVASADTRTERIRRKYGFGIKEAEQMLMQSDKKHKRYISTLYGVDWEETFNYDMVLNTDDLTAEQCADMIALLAESKDKAGPFSPSAETYEYSPAQDNRSISFKHPAEEEFARILDMYGIEWQYEPRTFPVQWDAEGNVKMAFSPDFYLVRFDTYIEITTMDQKYVTTKNKKVKRLRELYPGININIVYKKDFNSLLKRFGFGGGDVIDEFNRSERNSVQRGNDKQQGEGAGKADK